MDGLFDISRIWQDWQTVRLIGEGSFGKVYEIVRKRFGIEERCALKVITIPTYTAEIETLRNDGLDDKSVTLYYRGLVEEVVQEIALMKKLRDNNNIVRYEDFQVLEHEDTVGWDIIIRMELLKAATLHFREISLTVSDVLHLGIDMCKALEECETHKIIHRDIKPDNIFISKNGTYKLGDFGVARTIDRTMSGLSKKGTYTYMAPEVYRGEEYGATVDIYSLGIVMYKLLNNNREPFLPPYPQTIQYSDKNNALVYRMSGKEILPIPGVDERLNSVILKACAYKSEDRYRSATQLKEELQNILDALNEKESVVASGETLKTKNDETLSVFDSKRFETSVKPNVAEEKKANAEEAKPEVKNDVDAPSSKEPYIRIEQEENLEGTIGMFAKVPVPEKAPEEASIPQLSEKKEPQKPTEDIVKEPQKTENKEIKEKKKPKWWIPLIAVLGAAVVAAIIIATVSCTGNAETTVNIVETGTTASREIVTSSVYNLITEATTVAEKPTENVTTEPKQKETLPVNNNESYTDAPDIIIDTQTVETITVFFDANGGWVSDSSITLNPEDEFGNLPVPEKENAVFEGWYTKSVGGTKVTASTKVQSVSTDTLYAHWTETPMCTVIYDGNENEFPVGTTITYEASLSEINKLVIGIQGTLTYDHSVLKYKSASFPVIGSDIVYNPNEKGTVIFLATSLSGYDFADYGGLISVEFEVIGEGSAYIDTNIEEIYDSNYKDIYYSLESSVY